MLVRSGIHLVKFWFSVSRREQQTRFVIRQVDPVRQWKLSPTDLASLDRWDDYTEAKEAMFFYTDTADAPWTVIKSNDKKRARIQAMRHVLSRFEYDDKDAEVVGAPDPLLVGRGLAAVRGRRTTDPPVPPAVAAAGSTCAGRPGVDLCLVRRGRRPTGSSTHLACVFADHPDTAVAVRTAAALTDRTSQPREAMTALTSLR